MVAGDEDGGRAAVQVVGLEDRPEPGDVDPQRVLLAGCVLPPEILEQAVGGHDAWRREREVGQEHALLAGAQVQRGAVAHDHEWAEEQDVHTVPSPSNPR